MSSATAVDLKGGRICSRLKIDSDVIILSSDTQLDVYLLEGRMYLLRMDENIIAPPLLYVDSILPK